MSYSWQISEDVGLSFGTNALYFFAREAVNSGVAYDVTVSDAGDQLGFKLDTWINGTDFWVSLDGSGFSTDVNDGDFHVDHVDVVLLDAEHGRSNPLFSWQGDTDIRFENGDATRIEVINYQWDGSAFQAKLESGIDKLKARLDIFSNWSDLTNELWDRIANNKWYYSESVNDEGTQIARKYYLNSSATGSANAIAELFVHGTGLSLDRYDPEFTVSGVDGTVEFLVDDLGDDNVATFSLDLTQEVSGGWVNKLELNGGHVSFAGLTAWLDSEWDQATRTFDFGFATTGFSVDALIDGLGLDGWRDSLSSGAQVNDAGTEILLRFEPSRGLIADVRVIGAGFSDSISDADFDLSGVSVAVTESGNSGAEPLFAFESDLALSVREGTWRASDTSAIPSVLSSAQEWLEQGQRSLVKWQISFDRAIQPQAGDFYLERSMDDGSVERIDLSPDEVQFSDALGHDISITSALRYSNTYALKMGSVMLKQITTGVVPDDVEVAARAVHWRDSENALSGVVTKSGEPSLAAPAADDGAITLTDVLGALKVYLNKPLPEAYASPYNNVAADFNADGTVNLTDVLSLLKYYLNKPTTDQPTWAFANAQDLSTDGDHYVGANASLSPSSAHLSALHDGFIDDVNVSLVGILRGDVDGSWVPSSGQ